MEFKIYLVTEPEALYPAKTFRFQTKKMLTELEILSDTIKERINFKLLEWITVN